MHRRRIKLAVARPLCRLFRWIAQRASDLADRLHFCSVCGRNVYTGEPCVPRRVLL